VCVCFTHANTKTNKQTNIIHTHKPQKAHLPQNVPSLTHTRKHIFTIAIFGFFFFKITKNVSPSDTVFREPQGESACLKHLFFQSVFLSILYIIGNKTLQIWDKEVRNGHIKYITDQDIQSIVLEIMGTNVSTNHITYPTDKNKTLVIKLPFLVMIIKNVSFTSPLSLSCILSQTFFFSVLRVTLSPALSACRQLASVHVHKFLTEPSGCCSVDS
jgi:hypothetical protein